MKKLNILVLTFLTISPLLFSRYKSRWTEYQRIDRSVDAK